MTINLSALQKQRRDTAANWTAEDPTLLAGEIGLESDTGYWKVGDGATAWTSLAYVSGLGAEIPVDRLADGAARQLLQTDAAGTGVEWTDNVDVPGTLDVTGTGTFDGNVTIAGDLTVNGTTTTINTQDLLVEDKNVIIGNVTTPSDVTADGGGITLKGTTDKTINWVDSTDAWTLSEHVDIASGKEYRIAGTKVLDATSLGSAVVSSSLTSVGTIGTGVWQGTAIDAAYLDSTVVTTGDTGTVTSTMIADGTIVDGDVNASAAIAGTKISPDFGAQNVTTTGTSTAASFTPTSSTVPTNGVYLPAANSVALSTNGTGRLFVDANGNIGVGVTAPGFIAGYTGLQIDGGSDGPVVKLTNSTTGSTSADGFDIILQQGGSEAYVWQRESAPLVFGTAATERLRITAAGLVGVGTSSASSLLHVRLPNTSTATIATFDRSDGAVASEIHYDGSDGRITFGTTTNHPLSFETNNTRAVTIDTSQRVGIGTATPGDYYADADNLVVASSGATGITLASSTTQYGYICFADGTTGSDPYRGYIEYAHQTDHLALATAGTQRLLIDSSGRLLVGTSSSATGVAATQYAKLQVNGNTGGNSGVIAIGAALDTASVVSGSGLGYVVFADKQAGEYAWIAGECDGTPGTGDYPGRLVFSTTADGASSPTERLRISSNGTFTGSATNDISDQRLKQNIQTITDAVAKVKALSGRTFEWKPEAKMQCGVKYGFIAQEVEAVVPELVECQTGIRMLDQDGNVIENPSEADGPCEYAKSVQSSGVVPILVEALKEALTKIETLEAKVAALETA